MSAVVSPGSFDEDMALWRQFAGASDIDALPVWFELLCRQMGNVYSGLVLMASGDSNAFLPIAVWPSAPDASAPSHLLDIARESLGKRRGVIQRFDQSGQMITEGSGTRVVRACVAYPVESGERLVGALVVDVRVVNESDLVRCLHALHWGSGWWLALVLKGEVGVLRAREERYAQVLRVFATVNQGAGLQSVLFSLVNTLADQFACERVSFGWVKGDSVGVAAMSRAAWFDKNSVLIRSLGAAMDETRLSRTMLSYCGDEEPSAATMPAHAALAREEGHGLLSLPLHHGREDIAVVLLQRPLSQPFTTAEKQWLDTFAALISPVILAQRAADRSLLHHAWESLKGLWSKLSGSGHYTWKLGGVIAAVLIVVLTLVPVTYRVAAKTAIEGQVQRVIPAPFAGFVSKSLHRAGETVRSGELLAELDDKDLLLERAKWASESEQYARKWREAMADRNLSDTQVIGAQYAQAQAQLGLVESKLARVQLTAPFDGIIVSGDLSQSIGEPVEEGKKLFEVAPLTHYKVVLKVDDRDIAQVRDGQHGKLVLSGLPGQRLELNVRRIVPVAVAEDGMNYFRVEADLADSSPRLRPGMEGIGKIDVGTHSLLWIWTHRFTDWLRLQVWTWW